MAHTVSDQKRRFAFRSPKLARDRILRLPALVSLCRHVEGAERELISTHESVALPIQNCRVHSILRGSRLLNRATDSDVAVPGLYGLSGAQ
jgi:hypothetical protein